MKYKTCVSIGETSPKKVVNLLRKALKESDYAEIRFDFIQPNKIPETLQLCRKYLKRCVCTLRPKSEGGKFSGSEFERIAILKLIAEFEPFLIDVEFNILKKNKKLRNYLSQTKSNVLISWHDFKKTPKLNELVLKLNQMSKYSQYVKIVTTAKHVQDPAKVLALYSRATKVHLIAFCMGEIGKISRIVSLYMGAPFTYVSLGKAVAPGQYSLQEFKKLPI